MWEDDILNQQSAADPAVYRDLTGFGISESTAGTLVAICISALFKSELFEFVCRTIPFHRSSANPA